MNKFDKLKINELAQTAIESLEEIYQRIDSQNPKSKDAERLLFHFRLFLIAVKSELSEDRIKAVFEQEHV